MLQGMVATFIPAPSHTFAEIYIVLMSLLSIMLRTVQNWRKRTGSPKPAANGLHKVANSLEFMTRHVVKGNAPATDHKTALSTRNLLAEVEERELLLAAEKGDFVSSKGE